MFSIMIEEGHEAEAPRRSEYVELEARSCFSFLQGASAPAKLVRRAAELGYDAIAIADVGGLYGIVRAMEACEELERAGTPMRLVVGCELGRVLLHVADHAGYTNLCRVLTRAHSADRDLEPRDRTGVLDLAHLAENAEGLWCTVLPTISATRGAFDLDLAPLKEAFGPRLSLAVRRLMDGQDARGMKDATEAGRRFEVPLVATGGVRFATPEEKPVLDVLHCIRHGLTLDEAGRALLPNSERCLRTERAVRARFPTRPELLARAREIADACTFSMRELRYHFPCELDGIDPSADANRVLSELTHEGAKRRWPGGVSEKVRAQIEKELALIAELEVAPYFLTVWDVVEMARRRDILCQGRGSAANSAVCYCLGVTAVDPARASLLFERFLSPERTRPQTHQGVSRGEPPDIDVDFEHERREEVIQDVYAKYGRERAAMVSEVICYRGRSALREVGKVFGLSIDQVERLSGLASWWDGVDDVERRLGSAGFDPKDTRVRRVLEMARAIQGTPRHLSIHVGGFVLSARPLAEIAPVQPATMPDRTVIPWDKDDVDTLGFFKMDVLGLGMLTAIRKALDFVYEGGRHSPAFAERTLPLGDSSQGSSSRSLRSHPSAPRALGSPPLEDVVAGGRHSPAFAERTLPLGDSSQGSSSRSLRSHPSAPRALGSPPLEDVVEGGRHSPAFAERTLPLGDSSQGVTAAPGRVPTLSAPRPTLDLPVLPSSCSNRSPPPRLAVDLRSDSAIDRLARVPAEDHLVYDAMCRADTVGVFQIESRAQMAMLPRLKPRAFYDLVVEVAIVRPGPIQGGMVHPYLRRRAGEEPIDFPHPVLVPILERTLGVPLFQEQVMQISIVGAGYTGGEADQLRRDMAAWKRNGRLERHRARLREGFLARGISEEFAERLYAQIQGFGEYGFPESHAASFALLVYASAWLKVHHPEAFAAALVNSQPMGFYSPNTILEDARRHGVETRPVCVQSSAWDCTLEPAAPRRAIRAGLRLVKGLGEDVGRRVEQARAAAPFASVEDLEHRAALDKKAMTALAEAGALEALAPGRRNAVWRALAPKRAGLLSGKDEGGEAPALPALSRTEQLVLDFERTGTSPDHPMRLVRARLPEDVLSSRDLERQRDGARVRAAGMVICRQRPGTASGVVFMTLEDELGFANLVLYARVFEHLSDIATTSALVIAEGIVQREGRVVHLVVQNLRPMALEREVPAMSRDFH